ncbi:bifunctional DNA primase/polymerase [Streptomyces iconiensis]|uniref:Bifunctional DNA primase/polymerase n=1 Tax=Streptomyces iconiensis TaxID=1384038 RepID=A0ABT6ZWN4_9ACTN|nr:bifunctional DNA primase/polymerase [Streptomyces iconiensis]MDJ1133480.1 bifunctional DNA primase/polymerase [Streptomyces iconiensis]
MESESRIAQWLRRKAARSGPAKGTGTRRWGGARGANPAAVAEAARDREALLLTAAAAGFPLAPAAHPSGYGCSCVRIGCPTPGRHPVSFAWQTQATTDQAQIERWLRAEPQANFITATGRSHDVLDVPVAAGHAALERLEAEERQTSPDPAEPVLGPVALSGRDRMLFFTATRGTPEDEDEWWPCELDCHPETLDEHPGLRWHCRGSYVLMPPAELPDGEEVRWLRSPEPGATLPEPLVLLETLSEYAVSVDSAEEPAPWPVR